MPENRENPVGGGISANISAAYRSHYLSCVTGEHAEGGAFRNADVFLKCLLDRAERQNLPVPLPQQFFDPVRQSRMLPKADGRFFRQASKPANVAMAPPKPNFEIIDRRLNVKDDIRLWRGLEQGDDGSSVMLGWSMAIEAMA